MNEEAKDVDLYKDLEDALKGTEKEDISGAGTKKESDKEVKPEEKEIDNGAELSEEEVSKLSPRAQKRIRDLAKEVKTLSEKEISPKEEDKEIVPEVKDHKFKDVNEFLSAVADEPSRKLLENFYKVIKGETSNILAPLEAKNNEAKFETAFGKYEKIDGISDYKDELRKTFLNNPSQDIDSLFSKTVTDIVLNKVKPIEKKPSEVNRDGDVSLEGLSTDELYTKLEGMRGK